MLRLLARSPRLARWAGRRLIRQGRLAEADALLEAALAAHPGHPRLVVPYAFAAHQGQRYAEALERWTRARAVRPELPMPWGGIAANARVLGEHEQAEQALVEGLRRFADDPLLLSEAARLADDQGRHGDGLVLWQRLVEGPAADAECWRGYVHDLVKVSRLDEARAALATATHCYPGAPPLAIAEIFVALARQELARAMVLARDFTRRFPDDLSGRSLLGHVMMERGLAVLDGLAEDAVADVDVVEDDEVRTLLLGFESLGIDCELGLVQRHYGAEPIGLLRWNDVDLDGLLAALDADFASMGSTETTLMTIGPRDEYYVYDARWGLGMHTFLVAGEIDSLAVLPKMRRRVAFLRDKLLADLIAAEKVFVYKSDEIDLASLRGLQQRVAAHGPARVLNVRSSPLPGWQEPSGPPGTTQQIGDGLHIGYLSRMGNVGRAWDIAFEDWIALCRSMAARPPGTPR